jgi:hypothetical protein
MFKIGINVGIGWAGRPGTRAVRTATASKSEVAKALERVTVINGKQASACKVLAMRRTGCAGVPGDPFFGDPFFYPVASEKKKANAFPGQRFNAGMRRTAQQQ